jgi:beta-1,4-mannosyltransferase
VVQEQVHEPAAGGTASGRCGIASFPPVLDTNAYQRLVYEHLRPHGFELEPSGRFGLGWLRRSRARVDVLHFHWPGAYYVYNSASRPLRLAGTSARLALFAGRLAAARALGYRIVWTIHQPQPHESAAPALDRLAGIVLARAANDLHVHDRNTEERARRQLLLGSRPVHVIPHGAYDGVYAPPRPAAEARAELGIAADAYVFLAFGLIRRYKDVDALTAAFSALDEPEAVLLVAGMPIDDETAATVRAAAAADPRIRTILEFVPDDRVADLYAATDAAVVARADGGTSGALVLALSLGVPVVAANSPTYAELTGGGKAGWLFDPADPEGLRRALAQAVADRDRRGEKAAAAEAAARALAWPAIAGRLAAVLRGSRRA